MKWTNHRAVRRLSLTLAVLGALSAGQAHAQTPGQPSDSLQRRLRDLAVRIDSLEAGSCPASAELAQLVEPAMTGVASADSLALTLWRLETRVRRLVAARCAPAPGGQPAKPDSVVDELAALRAAAVDAGGAEADTTAGPVQFVGKQRSGNALNPEISGTGDIRLVARSPGPQKDNAVVGEYELAFQSTLDPYSNTKIFLGISEEEVGVEEGYIYWTGLPGNVRLDLGKFRQQVGDLNRWHQHALPESDYPLVYQRYFGDEGLTGLGLSLYSALPISLGGGTHELWLQGTSASSEPLFENSRQPALLGRLLNFWQLNRSSYIQFGLTGLGGNSSDANLKSRVMSADFRVTWRPPNAGNRQDLTFRAEGYRFHATEAGEGTDRYGAFAELLYRASQRWSLGTRYDWVEAPRGPYQRDWQIVPTLAWTQSEFVYLRLEGRHGWLEGAKRSQLLVQVVWAMGPHKHEAY